MNYLPLDIGLSLALLLQFFSLEKKKEGEGGKGGAEERERDKWDGNMKEVEQEKGCLWWVEERQDRGDSWGDLEVGEK